MNNTWTPYDKNMETIQNQSSGKDYNVQLREVKEQIHPITIHTNIKSIKSIISKIDNIKSQIERSKSQIEKSKSQIYYFSGG